MHPNDYLTWDKGRRERTLMAASRLFAVLATLLFAVRPIWEQLECQRAFRDFPAPGHLIDIGGRQIQIDCRGVGSL
jgi:hypothetical protein